MDNLMQHCPYKYDPPVHKHMCHRYIYMTAVNIHRSNLRNTGVLKLLQHKNQLLVKSQILVIAPTYSLTNPQKFLNTVFFLYYSGAHFERIHKSGFYRMAFYRM